MPKKEKIRRLFNDISPEYDKLNHILSLNIDRLWRKRAVRRIVSRQLQSILDVACGTGDFSIAIAKEMAKGSHVTGLDLSEGMLEVMRAKVIKAGLGEKISLKVGDCEALPFYDESFDRVSVAFGVRNFENREQGLREMQRVLKKGGRLVILELSLPSNKFMSWLFNLYFFHIVPLIGGKVSGDTAAYNYLPASVKAFPRKREFKATLSACGFRNVRHKALSLGICRMYIGEK